MGTASEPLLRPLLPLKRSQGKAAFAIVLEG